VAEKKYVKRVSELVAQVSGNYGENMLKGRARKEVIKRKKGDRIKRQTTVKSKETARRKLQRMYNFTLSIVVPLVSLCSTCQREKV
jgi:hypothetical protein